MHVGWSFINDKFCSLVLAPTFTIVGLKKKSLLDSKDTKSLEDLFFESSHYHFSGLKNPTLHNLKAKNICHVLKFFFRILSDDLTESNTQNY